MKMRFNKSKILTSSIIFVVFFAVIWFLLFSAPKNFPTGVVIKIEEDASAANIIKELESARVIKNTQPLSFIVKALGKEKSIQSGDYVFDEPLSMFGVVMRIIKGDFNVKMTRVTIPEGSTLKSIAEIFSSFENFNKKNFLTATKNLEGYLFPDTYFFSPYASTDEITKIMRNNFKNKVGDIGPEVIIMASLIEKEVANKSDRRIVSGILWKRLNIGMPLQVDAIFPYIIGKKSFELTPEDLKIDSPYNTYLHKGLPPYPIASPGLDAIEAALNPVNSAYFYYLSDKEGNTHYAVSLDEHKTNKRKYLLN
ncbi:MAG: endolytic transglycosylase MltG [Patescibacteria group bacterium]